MQTRPEPPPEGKLIAAAADHLDLSIREAARRAGISYGRWRQIVMGYQNVSPGEFAVVRAPAKTLAKMAGVVGVSPEQLETIGQRPDAADAMRHEQATPAPKKTGVRLIDEGASDEELKPFIWQVEREVERVEASQGDGSEPSGEAIFGPGHEADAWNSPIWDRDTTIRMLATFRLFAYQNRGGESGVKTGLGRFRVLSGSP